MSRVATIIVATIGTALMMIFVLGLAQSISVGFAGFWGAFPFIVIAVFVIALALVDFWQEAVRDKSD